MILFDEIRYEFIEAVACYLWRCLPLLLAVRGRSALCLDVLILDDTTIQRQIRHLQELDSDDGNQWLIPAELAV